MHILTNVTVVPIVMVHVTHLGRRLKEGRGVEELVS